MMQRLFYENLEQGQVIAINYLVLLYPTLPYPALLYSTLHILLLTPLRSILQLLYTP